MPNLADAQPQPQPAEKNKVVIQPRQPMVNHRARAVRPAEPEPKPVPEEPAPNQTAIHKPVPQKPARKPRPVNGGNKPREPAKDKAPGTGDPLVTVVHRPPPPKRNAKVNQIGVCRIMSLLQGSNTLSGIEPHSHHFSTGPAKSVTIVSAHLKIKTAWVSSLRSAPLILATFTMYW